MSANGAGWPWNELALDAPTQDARTIRRAYAKVLKSLPPEDADAFQRLRSAYDFALARSDGARPQRRSLVGDAIRDTPEPPRQPRATLVQPDPAVTEQDLPADTTEEAVEPQADDPVIVPKATPSPWKVAPPQRLTDKVEKLLAARVYTYSDWDPVFAALQSESPDMVRAVERNLVKAIGNQGQTPPDKWILAADAFFGWRADGVGFQRRFPHARATQEIILGAAPPPSIPIQIDETQESAFSQWVAPPLVVGGGAVTIVALLGLFGVTTPENLTSTVGGAFVTAAVYFFYYVLWRALVLPVLSFAARIHPVITRRSRAFGRWLVRPVWRVKPALLFRLGVAILIASLLIDPMTEQRPFVSARDVREGAGGINQAMHIAFLGDVLSFQQIPPTLFIQRDTPQTGPLDPAMTLAERWQFPDAMIRCHKDFQQPLRCGLSIRLQDTVIRAMEVSPPHPLAGWHIASLERAVVVSRQYPTTNDMDVRLWLPETWPWIGSSFSQTGPVQIFAGMVRSETFPMFAPQFAVDGQIASDQTLILPTTLTPLALVGGWPAAPVESAPSVRCRIDRADEVDAALQDPTCALPEDAIDNRLTVHCPQGGAQACRDRMVIALYEQDWPQDWIDTADDAVTIDLSAPSDVLMRDLMLRLTSEERHPPLPDTDDVRLIRDQVLWQYAVILGHPSAGEAAKDRATIRQALAYQPHLYRAFQGDPQQRATTWDLMIDEMTRIGFDMSAVGNME
ncbi:MULTISPECIES: hypothetical protein [unclassified Yoonia]|uniref:hypothetical protein n=1 Tax=unclassified Yoonia TaxID=2629118 RepID=UPI002AFFB347|nr:MULTISPECIES: hypothetical protein [unclassified Yoonia]